MKPQSIVPRRETAPPGRRGPGRLGRVVLTATWITAAVGLFAAPGWAAFEAYSQGDLNGQNGWDGGIVGGMPVPFTNNEPDSNVVTNADALTGTQSWRYSGSYGSPGAGTPFTRDVATVGAPNAATAFGPASNSEITPAGDRSVVSFAFRAVAPGDGSRINLYEGSYARDSRTGASLYLETTAVGTVHLYFFELSSTDECTNQDFPTVDVATVAAGSWHTVKMTTTYPNATPGDLTTYGTTTYVVDEGQPGEVTATGDSAWVHPYNVCNGTPYAPGGSLKFSNSFNDYPFHQGFFIDDLSMVVSNTSVPATVGTFATSFEQCSTIADCDDANACTDDTCDSILGCQHVNNAGPCTDGDACTTESCSAGACVTGTPPDCDDTNVCTDDSCDTVLGCQNAPNSGPCTDDNACTTEACAAGTCTAGTPTNCDDMNACTDDSCDISLGCQHLNNAGPCPDGNACTTESCVAGACVPEGPTSCDDGNVCTDDSCDMLLGCLHTNNSGPCPDGNACTAESCVAGACVAGTPPNCNDSNQCTVDSCDIALGCQHVNLVGTCTDDNACTVGDVCVAGTCSPGSTTACDDGDPCTHETCDTGSGECTPAPAGPATGCLGAVRSALLFDQNNGEVAAWKWERGASTSCANFGNPSLGTDYDICVYDTAGPGQYELATSFHLPANALWKRKRACRWLYRDKTGSVDGIKRLRLKPSDGGRSAILLDASGPNTPMPVPVTSDRYFEMNPTVTVQMFNGTGTCWESEFTSAYANTGTLFKTQRRVSTLK